MSGSKSFDLVSDGVDDESLCERFGLANEDLDSKEWVMDLRILQEKPEGGVNVHE